MNLDLTAALPGADASQAPSTTAACPFLIAGAGAYRMSVPDRDHRCAAVAPATSLAITKQARLCLMPAHTGCATYVASLAAREARVGSGERLERSGRWGIARTMPVVEEVGGFRASFGALVADRRTWPAIPAVLLATLLLALGLSGSWGQAPLTAAGSPSPVPRPSPTVTASLAPASQEPTTEPASPPPPTATPAPTAPPPSPTPNVAYTTYKVKSGDTLSGIAHKYGVTVQAIVALNGITDPSKLHVGQILKIPTH
jgi:LysM repeat protein